jgi:membrane protease YdiL (CAAX protease family)
MIQGYRMAGPPPHGEPPAAPPPPERAWPPWLGFLTLLAVIVVTSLLAAIVISASGADSDHTPAWVDITSTVILQVGLIGGALLAARMIMPVHAWQFGLRATPWRSAALWTVVALAVFLAFAVLWANLIEKPEQTTAEDLGVDESQLALIGAGVLFVVTAPIAEELFFRGFCFTALRRWIGLIPGALATGVIFGLIHAGSADVVFLPPLAFLGMALCVLYYRTGSLLPCMVLHAFNNSLALGVSQHWDFLAVIALMAGSAAVVLAIVLPFTRSSTEPAAPVPV